MPAVAVHSPLAGQPAPAGTASVIQQIDDVWSVVTDDGGSPEQFVQQGLDGLTYLRSCHGSMVSVEQDTSAFPGFTWITGSRWSRPVWFVSLSGADPGELQGYPARKFRRRLRWKFGSAESQLRRYGYRDLTRSASGEFAVLHHPDRPDFPLAGVGGPTCTFLGAAQRLWLWDPALSGRDPIPAGPVDPFHGTVADLTRYHRSPAPDEQGRQLKADWYRWGPPVPHFHLDARHPDNGPHGDRALIVATENECRTADRLNHDGDYSSDVEARRRRAHGEPDRGPDLPIPPPTGPEMPLVPRADPAARDGDTHARIVPISADWSIIDGGPQLTWALHRRPDGQTYLHRPLLELGPAVLHRGGPPIGEVPARAHTIAGKQSDWLIFTSPHMPGGVLVRAADDHPPIVCDWSELDPVVARRLSSVSASPAQNLWDIGYRPLAPAPDAANRLLHLPESPGLPLMTVAPYGLSTRMLDPGSPLWIWDMLLPSGAEPVPNGPVGPYLGSVAQLHVLHTVPTPGDEGDERPDGSLRWGHPAPHFHTPRSNTHIVAPLDMCRLINELNRAGTYYVDPRQKPRPSPDPHVQGVYVVPGYHPSHGIITPIDDTWSAVGDIDDNPLHFLCRRPDGGLDMLTCGTPVSFAELQRRGYQPAGRSDDGTFTLMLHPARPPAGVGARGRRCYLLQPGRPLWQWDPRPVNGIPAGPAGPFHGPHQSLRLFHQHPADAELGPPLGDGSFRWSHAAPHFHLGEGPDLAHAMMVAPVDECRRTDEQNRQGRVVVNLPNAAYRWPRFD